MPLGGYKMPHMVLTLWRLSQRENSWLNGMFIYIYYICVCIKSTRISMKNISVLYSKPYNKIYCII